MIKLRNDQSGFTVVEAIIVIVVLVVIAGVGWLVYDRHHKSTAKNTSMSSAKQTATTPKTKTTTKPVRSNPYAGWRSYTSTAYGYNLKYPPTWVIEGWTMNTGLIPTSQLNGSESSVVLSSSSSKTNSFGLWINGAAGYKSSSGSEGSGFGGASYSDGSIVKALPNGISIWEQAEQSTKTQQPYSPNIIPDFEVVTNGQFGYRLKSGKFIQVSMGFGYAFKQGTTYTYSQQSSSSELKQAEDILSNLQ